MWILSTSNFSLVSFLKTSSTGFLSTLLPIKITFSKCLFKKDSLCESERDSFPLLSYNLFTNFPFVVLSLFPVTLVVPVLLSCALASTIVSVCVTQAVPALPSRASVSTIAFACVTGDSISVSVALACLCLRGNHSFCLILADLIHPRPEFIYPRSHPKIYRSL